MESNSLQITNIHTLPEDDSGPIVAWDLSSLNNYTTNKIGIATYDSLSPHEHKGSYYLYDLGKKVYQRKDLNVIDYAVDLAVCY